MSWSSAMMITFSSVTLAAGIPATSYEYVPSSFFVRFALSASSTLSECCSSPPVTERWNLVLAGAAYMSLFLINAISLSTPSLVTFAISASNLLMFACLLSIVLLLLFYCIWSFAIFFGTSFTVWV